MIGMELYKRQNERKLLIESLILKIRLFNSYKSKRYFLTFNTFFLEQQVFLFSKLTTCQTE